MLLLFISVGLCSVALLSLVLRHEKPWPREGHGHTYFSRTFDR
jgi:hypothetical protein